MINERNVSATLLTNLSYVYMHDVSPCDGECTSVCMVLSECVSVCVCMHTYFLGKAWFETLFQIMLTPNFQLPDFS
jgi:hypothetical protein